ncbi:MAG: (d)CMP kinase [Syntrophus sp. (in: bacteria)]|nr:(d)CMP kinase [Syntrophus sp. (in: bacteria)]
MNSELRTTNFIITLDGPAGVGKSTVARSLAQRLDAVFLDTGAMYRTVTLAAVEQGLDPADTPQVERLFEQCRFEFRPEADTMRVFIDGVEKTALIRDPRITAQVRHIASAPALREKLVAMQRQFASQHPRIVTEGRDQGTVAFPNATVKFFLVADPTERAKRRHKELLAAGKDITLEQILSDQQTRDASDENRQVGPLKPAADSILVDTTNLTARQVIDKLEQLARQKSNGR